MGRLIPVIWLDAHCLCWDQAIIDDVVDNRLWPTGYEFTHHVDFDQAPVDGFAIVVVPARYHADDVDDINRRLAGFDGVLVILTSDEERLFPVEQLRHPNLRVWVQTPGPTDDPDYCLPVGYTPHLRDHLADVGRLDRARWVYAGQVNHPRRKELVTELRRRDDGTLVESPGFTQGLGHAAYAAALAGARVAPCPSGPHTVDTFRLWEALEAGALPLVDSRTPAGDASWYWSLVAPELDLPLVTEWHEFTERYAYLNATWPEHCNRLQSQWQRYKRKLAERLGDTVRELSGEPQQYGPVTVLVPTSPIAAHPDTSTIETTIGSIRHHLPDAEILVMCDGVRAEQANYRSRYDEYLGRLTWLCAHRWSRVLPIIHDSHLHQAEMTRRALDMVRTPLVLFVEHDAPIVTDEPIDFDALIAACVGDYADVIRLHHEAIVLPDHAHMMLDVEPQEVYGAPLLRTVQWSQRPHLATTAFYRRVIATHFPPGYVGMIEDVMHGVAHNEWRQYGLAGWDRYRLWMYAPPGNIKRSYTLDGRAGDPKWVDS